MLAILLSTFAFRAPALRMTAVDLPSVDVRAHERFLSEVALVTPPAALENVVRLLVSEGGTVVEPGTDDSVHPLLVPLTRTDDGEVTGLLRWPAAGGGGSKLPLVQTSGRQLVLLADSAEQHVARAAVQADADGDDSAELLAELTAKCGIPYEIGSAVQSPGGVRGYVLTKVGTFLKDYEALSDNHVASGSVESALITCERCQTLFKAWGRPFAFHARLLGTLDRNEEARDTARQALQMPLWTVDDDISAICAIACTTREDLVSELKLKAAVTIASTEQPCTFTFCFVRRIS